jgi:broad specificity phosphatase PhoE
MRRLVLAKHARPDVRGDLPASEWGLTEDGLAGARRLAERLRVLAPSAIVSSAEPKASATARIVAAALAIPLEIAADLHEHVRPQSGLLGDAEFTARIADLFARPHEVVFGSESASDALRRFTLALDRVIDAGRGDLVVISHGTVISLFVGARSHEDAHSLWSTLGLPSYVVLELPSFRLTEVVASV